LSDADDATGLLGAAAKYEMDELKGTWYFIKICNNLFPSV
jgi:hypothetical protein